MLRRTKRLPAAEPGTLCVSGECIRYSVVRSARRTRTMQLTVDAEGSVIVRTPLKAGWEEITGFIEEHGAWLLRQRAKAMHAPLQQALVSGASVPYLGADLTLAVKAGTGRRISVMLDGTTLRVGLPPGLSVERSDEQIRRSLAQWYAARAREVIDDLVRQWTPFAGKAPSRILIRNQKRR